MYLIRHIFKISQLKNIFPDHKRIIDVFYTSNDNGHYFIIRVCRARYLQNKVRYRLDLKS